MQILQGRQRFRPVRKLQYQKYMDSEGSTGNGIILAICISGIGYRIQNLIQARIVCQILRQSTDGTGIDKIGKGCGVIIVVGYKDFYDMLKGEKFDPDQWASLVKRSGAKYAGAVSEHADNFSMWDSAVNPINSMNYGPHRDIVGECTEAFRKQGIRTVATFHHQWLWGWFMSTDNEADVYIPENEKYYGPALPLETNRYIPYRYPDEAFCKIWRDKVLEVIDKYEPDEVYFDSRPYAFMIYPKEPTEEFSTSNAFKQFISCIIGNDDAVDMWENVLTQMRSDGLDEYIQRQNENFAESQN